MIIFCDFFQYRLFQVLIFLQDLLIPFNRIYNILSYLKQMLIRLNFCILVCHLNLKKQKIPFINKKYKNQTFLSVNQKNQINKIYLLKIQNSKNLLLMQQQNNQAMQEDILCGDTYQECEDFQILAENSSSPQQIFFDQVVAALQEIIVDDKFQHLQTNFMKQNCHVFDNTEENKIQYMGIFKNYQNQIQNHIEQCLIDMVPGFNMQTFSQLLQTRTDQIDQQILQILHSFSEFQTFKTLILDYKNYYQQEQRLKTLTLKSTKIPQNKKVKGNDNIFSSGTNFQIGNKLAPLKKNKNQVKQKTQDQLLIPDFVLTVRPLRKA